MASAEGLLLEVQRCWGEYPIDTAHLRPGQRRVIDGLTYVVGRDGAEAVLPPSVSGSLEIGGLRADWNECERRGILSRGGDGAAVVRLPANARLIVSVTSESGTAPPLRCIASLSAAERPQTAEAPGAFSWATVAAAVMSLALHGALGGVAHRFRAAPPEPFEVSKDDLYVMYRYLRATEGEKIEERPERQQPSQPYSEIGLLSRGAWPDRIPGQEASAGRWRTPGEIEWGPSPGDDEVSFDVLWTEGLKQSPRVPIVALSGAFLTTIDDEHDLLPTPDPSHFRSGWGLLPNDMSGWTVTLTPTEAVNVSPQVLQDIVRRKLGVLRICYLQGLLDNPVLQGDVTIKLTVGADGRVSKALIAKSYLPDRRVLRCLANTMYALRVPLDEPTAGSAMLRFAMSPPTWVRRRLH